MDEHEIQWNTCYPVGDTNGGVLLFVENAMHAARHYLPQISRLAYDVIRAFFFVVYRIPASSSLVNTSHKPTCPSLASTKPYLGRNV